MVGRLEDSGARLKSLGRLPDDLKRFQETLLELFEIIWEPGSWRVREGERNFLQVQEFRGGSPKTWDAFRQFEEALNIFVFVLKPMQLF